MGVIRSITLRNDRDEVARLGKWVAVVAERLDLDDRLAFAIDLCLAEAVTNVIDYGFESDGTHEVVVSVDADDRVVSVLVEDDGTAFDPLDAPDVEFARSLGDAPIGGLGIHLLRSYAQDLQYERLAGRNRLAMVFGRDAGRVDEVHIHIFAGLTDDEVRHARARFTERRLVDGEVLLTPGERNHHLYALVEGDLRVALDDPDSPQSFPVELGESVGEMSIIDGSPVSAYVIAEGSATVLAIGEDDFWEMTASHPAVARNLLAILTARMRRQHESARTVLEQQLQLRQLAQELDHARRIQAGMLPTREPLLPEHPELDIAASMEAAREVGGDFYDVFALDEERVAIVIGDVSGKGMPASLFMVEALTRLRVHLTSRAHAPLDDIVRSVNAELAAENEENMFTTLFVVVVDVSTGEMEYVNGGHNRPAFARADGTFDYLEVHSGMLVGIWDESPYELGRIALEPGDRFLLYTDGVTEAEDEARNLFSDERLLEVLDAAQPASALELLRTVRFEVAGFVGEAVQSDDITMAAFVFRGRRS